MSEQISEGLSSLGGWPGVLSRIVAGERLTSYEAGVVMSDVLEGNVSTTQLAAFLAMLRMRGETVDELAGFSSSMLAAAVPLSEIPESTRHRLVDTCGTGGDRSGTINVSTMAALVVAAAGVPVCKHGNRAASSLAGSADVLAELGVAIDLGPAGVLRCIEEAGIGFCLAPRFHPAFRHVGPTRRELGIGTAFNFLGPLVNPARVRRQVIGVSDPSVADLMLGVLSAHGATRAMIVHGHDGLDEITTTTLSTIHELQNGEVRTYSLDPSRFGLTFSDPASLKGGTPAENAERVRRIIGGEPSPQADIVALNAAAALVVGDAVPSFDEGFVTAKDILRDGRAAAVLQRLVQVSQESAEAEKG